MKAEREALAQAERELRDAEQRVRDLYRQYSSDSRLAVMEEALAARRARSRAALAVIVARRAVAEVVP